MTVWVLEWFHGADSQIVGVYSTELLAHEALARCRVEKPNHFNYGELWVQEHKIDSRFVNV